MPIYGESIFLRTLTPEDATPTYLSWLSDPTINAFLEIRFDPPRSVSDLSSFIFDSNTSSDTLFLGIFLCEDNRHIGNIKLGPIDWQHQVSEVGFLIGDKAQWGKGYASQAISMVSDFAFSNLGLAKLTAGCYAENIGSQHALIKAGYINEGQRISQWLVNGKRQDGLLLGRVNPLIASEIPSSINEKDS